MAMIKCPKCNEEISDKSEKCIHCGKVILEKEKIFCEECGNEIKEKDNICSKCGCPVQSKKEEAPQKVEVTKVKLGNEKSRKKIIIGVVIFLLIICAVTGGILYYNKEQKEIKEQEAERVSREYKSNLNIISYKMLTGSADAEECGNKIKKVWANTIWEDSDPETDKYTKKNGVFNDDFNDSLSALFEDPDFIKITDGVEENQKEVNKLMKDMKNPPEEWEDAYSDLKEYYDAYLTFTNLCINPSGSLQTFSTNFNDADTNALNGYNKIKVYLDY